MTNACAKAPCSAALIPDGYTSITEPMTTACAIAPRCAIRIRGYVSVYMGMIMVISVQCLLTSIRNAQYVSKPFPVIGPCPHPGDASFYQIQSSLFQQLGRASTCLVADPVKTTICGRKWPKYDLCRCTGMSSCCVAEAHNDHVHEQTLSFSWEPHLVKPSKPLALYGFCQDIQHPFVF